MGKKSRSKRAQDAQSTANDGPNQVAYINQAATEVIAPSAAHSQRVDSWRSYRNDATNLQSLNTTNNAPAIDPTAAPFVPGQSAYTSASQSRFTPYRPLRISNGESERQVLHQARLQFSGSGSQLKLVQGNGRYALRGKREMSASTHAAADTPIPSVELTGAARSKLGGRSTNEVVGNVVQKKPHPRTSRTPTPCPVPTPTQEYLTQANLEPYHMEQGTRKLLVVLDLNGTLLYRKNRSNLSSVRMRPGVTSLLNYLFDNHTVMVYTSARPENAIGMVNTIMSPAQRHQLVAIWARDKLDLTKIQYDSKVQVYKKLEKIWRQPDIQLTAEEGRPWDQTNTILVDDSHLKASSQPYNLLQVPEFINDMPRGDSKVENAWFNAQVGILKELQQKLEQLKRQGDVSRLIRQWQVGGARQTATSKEHQTSQAQKQSKADMQAEQLMTPKSPIVVSSDGHSDAPSCADAEKRSVSPIDESVWSSLLAGEEDTKDNTGAHLPPSPSSMGHASK